MNLMHPDSVRKRMKENERYNDRACRYLVLHTPNHYTYFGTLVEDVRELPQYKDPNLMKELHENHGT